MKVRLAAVVVFAALVAGCGGSGGGGGDSTSGADSVVPADAIAFATIDTDTSSAQVSSALKILRKFPAEPQAERQLRASLSRNGVDLATLGKTAGSEVDIAVVTVDDEPTPVGFARPSDEKAFLAQLDRSKSKHMKTGDWTVFSDKQAALDAVSKRSGDLSDDATYQTAMKSLPDDAIIRFYGSSRAEKALTRAAGQNVPPAALGALPTAKWTAGALTSADGAFKLEVHTKTSSKPRSATGLADRIPAGSIVALALEGGGTTIPASAQQQLAGLGQQIGIDLPALVGALNGPVIAYVRPGIPLPEVTIASRPKEPQRAAAAVGQLLARFASGTKPVPVPTPVDGGTLNKLDLGPVALFYGVNDGQLVVTDSSNALAELKGSVGRLSGDSVFKEAKDGAGMGDSAQGFLYVDMKDALPALSGFAQLANQKLPPQVESNLRPLRSALVYGSADGGVQTVVTYVKTS
jgi:hypothetical protein